MKVIERLESEVRGYCRTFPKVFESAEGSKLSDVEGRAYIDFFAGAGALNYGHNNPHIKAALLDYISNNGVTHALDLTTKAKCTFLETFEKHILQPRGLEYKVMFPGPTGTNAVEAALKLARKVTGRSQIVAFTNAFHGMTLGSLALTGNEGKRMGSGVALNDVTRMPFDGYFGPQVDTLDYMRQMLLDKSSGIDAPAAFIVETTQAEGGVRVASSAWLKGLHELAQEVGALLIVDDIQVGCGRTGPFFSFEGMGFSPDILCLSKSLSGYGLPFSLTLMRPALDQWKPGEHNGTFRGYNHAFVTATAAIEHYWKDDTFQESVQDKSKLLDEKLKAMAAGVGAQTRGRGLIRGLEFADPTVASQISRESFARGLLIETAGSQDQVLKLLPPLTIEEQDLMAGLDVIEESMHTVLSQVRQA